MRIVVLLSRMERAKEVIAVAAEKAARLEAGVTLLYVREEKLFALPIFGREEPSMDGAREHLRTLAREAGGEEWAVLTYDDDPVDRALLEAGREKATLLISDLEGEERSELIEKARLSLLLLEPGTVHECAKALAVFDPAYSGDSCLAQARRILGAKRWSAYLDYQVVPTMGSDISMDPMLDTLNIDVEIEEELMEVRRKAFMELCEAEGIPGTFEVGELGMTEDILNRAEAENAECLALIVEDHDTLFAEVLGELASRIRRDLLVCFQHP